MTSLKDYLLPAVIAVAIALYLGTQYNHKPQPVVEAWLEDSVLSKQRYSVGCDFAVYDYKDIIQGDNDTWTHKTSGKVLTGHSNEIPFVVRNFVSSWPASSKWTLDSFRNEYGKRRVKTGSESSIVYGGGTAGIPKTINQHIADMRSPNSSDYFTFDVTILQSIPQLRDDFVVPSFLQSWDNPEVEATGSTWHILSLGASRAGLPFHVHGKTWLGLVFGSKDWFIYPPGYGLPAFAMASFNPVRAVSDWLVEVLPSLTSLPKPPLDWRASLTDADAVSSTHSEFRPLECIQQAGDLFYLPDGWSHQTINIGEAVALGGQAAFSAAERLELSLEALKIDARNFDALKGAGLGLAHLALDADSEVKQGLLATGSGIVKLTVDNFRQLVLEGEDTWIVHFFDQKNKTQMSEFSRVWGGVAARVTGLLSIGAMDITDVPLEVVHTICHCDLSPTPITPISISAAVPLTDDAPHTEAVSEDSTAQTSTQATRPHIFLFPGGQRDSSSLIKVLSYPPTAALNSTSISDFAIDLLMEPQRHLEHGSVTSLTAKARRMLKQARNHLQTAVEVYPGHPETRGLLGEILGYLGDKQAMVTALEDANTYFSEQDRSHLSAHALASLYHKLATSYLTQSSGDLAEPLLLRSLQELPIFLPAMVDLAVSYVMAHRLDEAEAAWQRLKKAAPGHSSIAMVRESIDKAKDKDKGKRGSSNAASSTEAKPRKRSRGGGPKNLPRRKTN